MTASSHQDKAFQMTELIDSATFWNESEPERHEVGNKILIQW